MENKPKENMEPENKKVKNTRLISYVTLYVVGLIMSVAGLFLDKMLLIIVSSLRKVLIH